MKYTVEPSHLGARKVHAAPSGECVPELAGRTADAMFVQVFLETSGLVVGVVGLLPLREGVAADALVGVLPLKIERASRFIF